MNQKPKHTETSPSSYDAVAYGYDYRHDGSGGSAQASQSAAWSRTLTEHRGSSWITDGAGNACTERSRSVNQHLQYLPFGEQFIDQRTNHDIRYKFTTKEEDSEIKPFGADSPNTLKNKQGIRQTGYQYFGARYYASNLSIWLSVDPLSDEYPSTSPYMYVLGNPIALIDPNGMNAWIPPTEEGGDWTAEAGDSPGSLARDAGISQSEAEGIMRDYNKSNNNKRSSDIMVYNGDKVSIPGNSSSENSSTTTTSNYNQYPSSGRTEAVSVVGVLGDLACDLVSVGLQELGMSEKVADGTATIASYAMIFVTKKPRIRGTNIKSPSVFKKPYTYSSRIDYMPKQITPMGNGGSNTWLKIASGIGLAGGVAYYRIKRQLLLQNNIPMIQPIPQDHTFVHPIFIPQNR